VKDPATAELLMPTQVIGCKRLCLDTGYYETFNRDNVTLVAVDNHPIERITEHGLVVDGVEHTFDVLVYATGFDAMTGSLLKIDIRGRNSQSLADAWHAGPVTYLGLNTAGFPNMFMVSGPGSPSVLTNMIMSIEQHVEWIADCIAHMTHNNLSVIETTEQSQSGWVAFVNAVADMTLYPSCNSWYLGANVPGKPRVFMPLIGFPTYVDKCNEVVRNGYEGFVLA
jgi:cyclohexanone monooxygenase